MFRTNRRLGTARLGRSLSIGIVTLAIVASLAACDTDPDPTDHGIELTRVHMLAGSERTLVLDVETSNVHPGAVHGFHQIFVTLPESYEVSSDVHYPVLYLLHGGGGGRSSDWTLGAGDAEAITAPHDVITVMPDGGKVGWYTNWINSPQGAQAWKDFHLDQLVPWIDDHLRTIPDRSGRAIAGLSMGGYGAIHYAQERPDLFSYAASFSGALDIEDFRVQATIAQQSIQNGFPGDGAFAGVWAQNNPVNHAAQLADVDVNIYTGSGSGFLDLIEGAMAGNAQTMHDRLNAAGIDHFYWNYGQNPPGSPYSCDGGHNFGCWNFALHHAMPNMIDVLADPVSLAAD